jgi:hypothetical protein
MKRILFTILMLAIAASGWSYGIVNNSGSLSADSLNIPFYLLDSAGNATTLADGDSIFIVVWYPDGTLAKRDSGAYNDGDITSSVNGGKTFYNWQMAVADYDGTGTNGVYSYEFSIHDKTSANLWTSATGHFQLFKDNDIDSVWNYVLDSVLGIIDVADIANGAFMVDKFANNFLTSNKIATGAFATAKFPAGVFDGTHFDAGWIDSTKFAADAITAAKIKDDAIDASSLSSGAGLELATAFWGYSAGERELTRFAEDVTVIDINGTTIGTATNVTTLNGIANDVITAAALAASAAGEIRDSVWLRTVKTLSALGFDLDSSMFANNTFPSWLFTTLFFDSAQGSAAGLDSTVVYGAVLQVILDTIATVDVQKMAFWEVPSDTITWTAGSMADSILSGTGGGLTTVQADSILGALADASMRIKIWRADTATYNNVAGAYGTVLANPAYVQGAASLTADQIVTAILHADLTDYSAADSAATVGWHLAYAGDTSLWASVQDFWVYQDTVDIDTSNVGAWFQANTGMFDPDVDYVMVDYLAANTITPASMQANCITSNVLSASALTAIYTRNWGDTLTTPGQTARQLLNTAYYFRDSTWAGRTAYGGWVHKNLGNNCVGPLDTASLAYSEVLNIDAWNPTTDLAGIDTAAIADAVWGRDSASARAVAGSMGFILGLPAYVQGANDPAAVAWAVWRIPTDTAWEVGSIGEALAPLTAAGFDSTATYGAVSQAIQTYGLLRYSAADSILKLKGIDVIANRVDSGAIYVKNASTDAQADGISIISDGRSGLYIEGPLAGIEGYGIYGYGLNAHSDGAAAAIFTGDGTDPDILLANTGRIQGYVDSLSAVGINIITDSLVKMGMITYSMGADSVLQLAQVNIISSNADSGAVNIINTSTDAAATGLLAKGYLAGLFGWGADGAGIYGFGIDYGIRAVGTDYGLYAVSTTGRGAMFSGVTYGLALSGNTYDIALLGSGDAQGYFDVDFDSRAAIADSTWADSAQKALVVGTLPYALAATASTAITNESISNQIISDFLALVPGDTATGTLLSNILANSYLASSGGDIGSGTGLLVYYFLDTTCSPDSMASEGSATIRTLSGGWKSGIIMGGGYIAFNASLSDTFIISGDIPGRTFPVDTVIMNTWIKYDTSKGYNLFAENKCRVYAYGRDIGFGIDERFEITLIMKPGSGRGVKDTCSTPAVIMTGLSLTSSPADANGYAYVDAISNTCFDKSVKYKAIIESADRKIEIDNITVPETSTYNLADAL